MPVTMAPEASQRPVAGGNLVVEGEAVEALVPHLVGDSPATACGPGGRAPRWSVVVAATRPRKNLPPSGHAQWGMRAEAVMHRHPATVVHELAQLLICLYAAAVSDAWLQPLHRRCAPLV
jgi:hypothetical protein